jgi:hypothetical protein
MWAFWVTFVIFLAEPRQVLAWRPRPTVDRVPAPEQPVLAACIDLALVAAFGLQHSVMAQQDAHVHGMAQPPVEKTGPEARRMVPAFGPGPNLLEAEQLPQTKGPCA